jgi:hypothetical protein
VCNNNVYCCETAQTCLPTPGPRGETRCSGPSLREAVAMGYDPARNNIILRGGHCLSGVGADILCTDQWTLGQTTWATQQPTTAVTPRWGSAMTWLPTTKTLLMFGGQTTFNSFATGVNDLYSWNGTDWTKLTAAGGPSARAFSAMAYDPGRQVLVLYGGNNTANASQSDTWTLSGTTWQLRTTATNPLAREGHAMIYEPSMQKVVMHGGIVAGAVNNDTWAYDGNDWAQLATPVGMTKHANFAMAYDSDRKVTVLFGGENAAGGQLAETWEFSSGVWTQKTPLVNPGKRAKLSMVYDQGRKQMVVFGGNSGANLLKDAWTWDGTTWSQLY